MLMSFTKPSTPIFIPSASHFSIKLALKNRKRIDEMRNLCGIPASTRRIVLVCPSNTSDDSLSSSAFTQLYSSAFFSFSEYAEV
jgi:hypothetical protein